MSQALKTYTQVISEYGQCVPKALLLDYFKLKIKEFSIALGIQKAQNYRDECKSLELLLDNLDKKLTPKKETIMYSKKKKRVKHQLDEHYKEKSRGYQIRSRAR